MESCIRSSTSERRASLHVLCGQTVGAFTGTPLSLLSEQRTDAQIPNKELKSISAQVAQEKRPSSEENKGLPVRCAAPRSRQRTKTLGSKSKLGSQLTASRDKASGSRTYNCLPAQSAPSAHTVATACPSLTTHVPPLPSPFPPTGVMVAPFEEQVPQGVAQVGGATRHLTWS